MQVLLSVLMALARELALDSDYTSDYAIESAHDNGMEYVDIHYLHYPLDYLAGTQW